MKIEIREISFAYHAGEPVLDHATALPQENSISILAGVNGCGKSTLLKTAAGILRPNSGSILLDGIPLKQIPPGKWPGIWLICRKIRWYRKVSPLKNCSPAPATPIRVPPQ